MIMKSSGRSTPPTYRRFSMRAATTNSKRHVTRPPMSPRSTGRAHRSRRTMRKVRWRGDKLDIVFLLLRTYSVSCPFLIFPNREASLPRDLPRQLCYCLPGAAAGGQRVYQRAVPSGDAHLHIPATGPQRVQRGLQELHREGPD